MPSFISSKNCPVYMNLLGTGAPNTGNQFFMATEAAFSMDSQLEANKTFGSPRISNDYGISGPQAGKFSMSSYIMIGSNSVTDAQNQLALVTGTTGDSVYGNSILFGNLLLKKCYLSSLNIEISPQAPILARATFDVYDLSSITGQAFTGANISNILTSNGSGAYLESIHALAMGVSGSGVSLPQSKSEISISTTCSRTSVYGLGAVYPSTVILESVAKSISLKGENIGNLIGFSGENAYLSLRFSPFSSFITGNPGFNGMENYLFEINTLGKVVGQNLEASENGLAGSIQILENVF